MTAGVSVVIPTFNEADHIAEVVANARLLGPVFVLDSCSTDGTQGLARQAGATVVEHAFEGYATQKNWGLDNLPLEADWVFILDADERITPELHREVLTAVESDAADGYFINRVLIFMGTEVRHGGLYPSWNLRLFRRGKCRYEDRIVHEHMICDGPTKHLKHEMLHIRREPLEAYIAKHIRYAELEATQWTKQRRGESTAARSEQIFQRGLRVRQWVRRNVWHRLPMRSLLRFVFMYFLRLGILDGRAGWHLAWLMANYEYMIGRFHDEQMRQRS
jgi:glycosyltransferase involved in cell wall biosynthesis